LGSAAAGRRQGGEVAVKACRVPPPCHAIEGVRPWTDGLVWPALPVGEVVPASVAVSRPVADLVTVEPCRAEAGVSKLIHRRRPIVVLIGARPIAPAPSPRPDRQVVAA